MAFVWNRHFSKDVIETGYDIVTKTLVVTLPDRVRRSYAPATYDLYDALVHARSPLRLFRERVEGKVPLVSSGRLP